MVFDGRNRDSEGQPGVGTATFSVTSLGAGALGSIVVSFSSTLPSAPRAVSAWISGFVSGSSLTVIKGTTTYTTSGFTLIVLNTGAGAATFTNLPITYMYVL